MKGKMSLFNGLLWVECWFMCVEILMPTFSEFGLQIRGTIKAMHSFAEVKAFKFSNVFCQKNNQVFNFKGKK